MGSSQVSESKVVDPEQIMKQVYFQVLKPLQTNILVSPLREVIEDHHLSIIIAGSS
jgi:hypothetical protein